MTVHSTMCFLSNIQTIYLTKKTNKWVEKHPYYNLFEILCRLNPVVNVQHIGCKGIQYRRPLALSEITNKMTNQSFTVMSDAFGKKHKCGIILLLLMMMINTTNFLHQTMSTASQCRQHTYIILTETCNVFSFILVKARKWTCASSSFTKHLLILSYNDIVSLRSTKSNNGRCNKLNVQLNALCNTLSKVFCKGIL